MNSKKFFITAFVIVILSLGFSQMAGATTTQMTFSRTLKIGTRGDDVKILQQFLISKNFLSGAADGIFGKMTSTAVKQFQIQNKALTVDGIVGPKTLLLLNQSITTSTSTPQTSIIFSTQPPIITSISISPTTPLVAGEPIKTQNGAYVVDNGDVVTLTGLHFIQSNNIYFSKDAPIMNVASFDGTSLTFTVNSSIAAGIEKSISQTASANKQTVLAALIKGWSQKPLDPSLTNGLYMAMQISIQNSNGVSNAIPIIINLGKGL